MFSVDSTNPSLYDHSVPIKVVEVAKKYEPPAGEKLTRNPEYTTPGGPNTYHSSKYETAWTQGFFPGMLWHLVERYRLDPSLFPSSYSEAELVRLARRYQADFESYKRPAGNHDQGFRFQLSYGKDFELTGDEHAKEVMIEAAESLMDRYNPVVGCIRSWDSMKTEKESTKYGRDRMDKHYLVIIDNMMNLDMLYEASRLTGDPKYAKVATHQAEKSMTTHVRKDYTTYHVVNFDQKTGEAIEHFTAQGYADDSVWSRGQAWGIYGYAQCALRTGRKDFLDTARKLADKFLSLLPASGVPWWDFKAPTPCPFDTSAATITARGLQMLYTLLRDTEPKAAKAYLDRGDKLIADTIRECLAPRAEIKDGKVDWGKDDWETILMHSTINGNPVAVRQIMDHGLVYADYYLVEYGNEALKLKQKHKA